MNTINKFEEPNRELMRVFKFFIRETQQFATINKNNKLLFFPFYKLLKVKNYAKIKDSWFFNFI